MEAWGASPPPGSEAAAVSWAWAGPCQQPSEQMKLGSTRREDRTGQEAILAPRRGEVKWQVLGDLMESRAPGCPTKHKGRRAALRTLGAQRRWRGQHHKAALEGQGHLSPQSSHT